ncbi:MAG: hypothetical protein GYB50_00610 [Rhodobacteraceae bacterium]|nr:hypothetical protein [Paracoccaceae bacterium]
MRASAERHDDMMERVGEPVIVGARLTARSDDPQLVAVAEETRRIPTGLRETSMSIRMPPIGSISGRFRRLVRDRNRKLGKPIELKIGAGHRARQDRGRDARRPAHALAPEAEEGGRGAQPLTTPPGPGGQPMRSLA